MSRVGILSVFAAVGLGLSALAYSQSVSPAAGQLPSTDAELREFFADSHSTEKPMGLEGVWIDCLDRLSPLPSGTSQKVVCKSWTAQGVESTLVALQSGPETVPVIENRLPGATGNRRFVIDVQGGPRGDLTYSNEAITEELLARLRRSGAIELIGVSELDRPYVQLMERGITVVSVGYWGTSLRTLEERNEFELGAQDVRTAINFYRDQIRADPPLITSSLGNHLALAALGRERLEGMNVLSLVPVMDGLQQHINRFTDEIAKDKADGKPSSGWGRLTVFKRRDEVFAFDHTRMALTSDYIEKYLGDADYPWKDVSLKGRCSTLVLGRKDPRTRDYIERTSELPPFVQVWDTDHDIIMDDLEKTRRLYADFADCLLEETT